MNIQCDGRGMWVGLCHSAAISSLVLLTACAAPRQAQIQWIKSGVDDATVAREVNDCEAQAAAVQKTEQGINEDRSATLGRNWALSYTTGLQDQTMQAQTAALVNQAFNSCMRAKGFTKAG
ncbi:MAG: hypothetical protein JO081_08410 [Alphaproteobacteria bacterium]|nr:hypothetical protein [Alphaproteobacteria bacterium]